MSFNGEFGSFRFGWDLPARIGSTAVMLQEQSELLPGQLIYTPLPFIPGSGPPDGSNNGYETTPDGYPIWQSTPTHVDLLFYEGDDVVIPLFFNDPDVLGDNMETDFDWFAQIRARHSYRSTLIADFSIKATYHADADSDPDVDDEYTKVELFLPRMFNTHWGMFQWEIYSISTSNLARFPKPETVDVADWPPLDQLRTWLFGSCKIVPRTTDTDYLPYNGNGNGNGVPTILNGGFFVGPNGRVP